MTKPAPLTPADSDLSDFGFMPLEVGRFRRSDLVTQEEPEAIVAAILLWGAAWHSKPAASLSNDDRSLAHAAGFGRAVGAFATIREAALRGFIECSDGRLYHPVVAEKALEAWDAKLKRLWRTECARVRKANERAREKGLEEEDAPSFEDWRAARYAKSHDETPPVTRDKALPSRVTPAASHARHDEDSLGVTRDSAPVERDDEDEFPSLVNEGAGKDEPDGMSRGQTPLVARDIDLDSCARAEKGQGQGQGQGDSIGSSLRSSPSTADDEIADEVPGDLLGRVAMLGRIAGLDLTRPAKLIIATDQLKAWEGEGFDFRTTIVPTIETRTRENPTEPVYSLRYFDAAIRKAAAVKAVGGPAKAPFVPPPPKPPIARPDSDDPRVTRFRSRLAMAVPTRYASRYGVGEVSVDIVDDRLLEVYFRSDAEEALSRVDEQSMKEVAGKLGLAFRTKVVR